MKFKIIKVLITVLFAISDLESVAQTGSITGKVMFENQPISFANVTLLGSNLGAASDTMGFFQINKIHPGSYRVTATAIGFDSEELTVELKVNQVVVLDFNLKSSSSTLHEIVITGTLKEVSRTESPVPVEIYAATYFRKNPTPNIYEALQNVNGVRPQLNCNVCNTGDIHINGLEGPYSMVLIDGMPVVSSLSTVYGLMGIPNSLIERIEVVKGPASSLYGSEAIGGLINIITKKPQNAPKLSVDYFGTSWGENNLDIGIKLNAGKKASVLTGLNYFNFQNRVDNNHDNFTDVTLQHRISAFQKWNFDRKENRLFSVAARYMYEDRFGGDMRWEKQFRGGDSIYGESIYTSRLEVLGNYQLPTKEKLMLSFSYNNHHQNSMYGITSYQAQQNIAFSQLTWDKKYGRNDLLLGTSFRYTYYDDNTPATAAPEVINPKNQPQITYLPGLFVQDEIFITAKHKVLLGFRCDYNSYHGNIFTPRLAYKWTLNSKTIVRLNAGTGFRVVNLFTEDHAALTGARIIEIKNELNPEQSYNANLNFIKKICSKNGVLVGLDASAFYTFYNNRIVGDYETDPNKIIYNNLDGFAEGKGISANVDVELKNGFKILAGGTLMENTITENGVAIQQILTENFTATWALTYKIKNADLALDYTGNVYSPMRLPLLGDTDPRSPFSPWWSIQNLQITYDGFEKFEIYGGIKNLLNWTPNKGNPFIIARANDPFDKEVQFGANGKALVTPNNPYGLTFDPTYSYGPNQGARAFLGLRLVLTH